MREIFTILPHPLPQSPDQYFIAAALYLHNLVGNSCLQRSTALLEEAEQQAEASCDVPPPPLQIVFSTPFCLFLFSLFFYPLSAPFLNPLSSPSPNFF